MKKTLLVLLALAFVSSLCFAAGQSTAPRNKTVPKPVVIKTLIGKVESVTLGDPVKKTRPEIVAIDDKGQALSFVVGAAADISGKDGKATTLDKIVKGDKVVVQYTTNLKGTHKAKSIRVVE
jgi:hypothetical protein